MVNVNCQNFVFGSRNQREGELLNDYLSDLRTLVTQCDFGELHDGMLRSRIIVVMNNKRLQERLINEDPTLNAVMQKCRTKKRGALQLQNKFKLEQRLVWYITSSTSHVHTVGFLHIQVDRA